jgi:hypothetical protein
VVLYDTSDANWEANPATIARVRSGNVEEREKRKMRELKSSFDKMSQPIVLPGEVRMRDLGLRV